MVLPSNFEPCGLEDFIAQLFGTIPVAHATGGLQKILHLKTGFLYEHNDPNTLARVLRYLADDYKKNRSKYLDMARYAARYTKKNYSWKRILADAYLPLYRGMIQCAGEGST